MNTTLDRAASQFRRQVGIAIVIALAVQGVFLLALALPETILPVAPRLALGVLSVPFSALCGTLFLRWHHPGRPIRQMALLFVVIALVIVIAGLLFSALTGNYDLP